MSRRGRRNLEIIQKSNAVLKIGVALDRREISLYGEAVDIRSEIHTTVNILCEQIVGVFFLILNQAVRKVATKLCEGLIQTARVKR